MKEMTMLPVQIHGKKYYTVAERLIELDKRHKGNYSLESEMTYFNDGVVIFRSTLKIGDNVYTGHAMEKEGSSMINKTSYIENAETSSWGRVLSAANIIVEGDTSVASADEVATAITNQGTQAEKPASDKQKYLIGKLCVENNIDAKQYVDGELTNIEASEIIQQLKGE
jgi:archaellum component FlaF (FlaF/FlaG flagellin family)